MNAVLGHPETPVAGLYVDTGTALSGGLHIADVGSIGGSRQRIPLDPGIVVSPGVTLGLQIPIGVALGGASVHLGLRWAEVDV